IFGAAKVRISRPRKAELACIFSEAEYLRRSQGTNKPTSESGARLHFAEREYLRRSQRYE
ncbi:MAG: hypothetical protein KHX48_13015, partial [Alistipes sp.]|nr:hypothetical protein [Alistipes sp.]